MSTQVVRHTSRGVDITLNFASTENNLSWSFTQEGDGEIYDVSSINVASYTIAGGAVTLPYAVTNGSSYAVSIVKTTTGQTASITLKTRRATNKTASLNVPDFGLFTGNYHYCLKNNGVVEVHDLSVKQPANYVGAGVWDTSSLVYSITLPPPPTNYSWAKILCVNGYVLVVAHNTVMSSSPHLYCKIIGGSVYDLLGNINSYSQITSGGADGAAYNINNYTINYDFINNIIYSCSSGTVARLEIINLTTLDWSVLTGANIDNYANITSKVYTSSRTKRLNPVNNLFIANGSCYFDAINKKNKTYIGQYTPGCYDSETGYILTSYLGQNSAIARFIDDEGNLITSISPSPSIAASNQGVWHYSNMLKKGVCVVTFGSPVRYGVFDKISSNFGLYYLSNGIDTTTVITDVSISNSQDLFIVKQDINSNRLTYIKYGQATPDYGYFDLDLPVISMCTNQLEY